MSLSITTDDLIIYHREQFEFSPSQEPIHNYVNSKGILAISKLTNCESDGTGFVPQPVNLSNLELDVDTLELNATKDRFEILLDHVTQDFVNTQRIHKANFLKEIRQKGLQLKFSNPQSKDLSGLTVQNKLNY